MLKNWFPKFLKRFFLSVFIVSISIISSIIVYNYIYTREYTANCRSDSCEFLSTSDKNLEKSLSLKISEFNKDSSSKKFLELTKEEFGLFLSQSISISLDNTLEVESFKVLYCDDNIFRIVTHIKRGNFSLGWFKFTIVKDDGNTVYFYIQDFFWNDVNISDVIAPSVNYQIKESILLINSESSADFVLDNIEFRDDSVIIRGHYPAKYY